MRKVKDRREITLSHIKAVRKRANLTQEQFAEKIGVSTNTISRIERNETPLTADVALRINEHFHISLDYLFGLTNYEEGSPPCSQTCEELFAAQALIDNLTFLNKELLGKLNAIQQVLDGKTKVKIKLKKEADC